MRAIITARPRTDSDWDVSIERETPAGPQPLANHRMARIDREPWVRPAGANLPPAGSPHAALCDDDGLATLTEIYGRAHARQPTAQDLQLLGRYLLDSLVGKAGWRAILAAAAGDDLIELMLAWPSDAAELHAGHWELMHDGDRFLASHRTMAVAIARVVADAKPHAPEQIAAPARVLFVLGAPLDDISIRPGAEVMGLLREVDHKRGGLNPKILDAASLRSLGSTVARWRPDILHLITHGHLNQAGQGEIRMRPDESPDRVDAHRDVSAPQLIAALEADGTLPPIVIVTGCESGASGPHATPFAVELVHSGIPIVIGMTGEVADIACRLFTRELGRVLATGGPLLEAVAHARRAAHWDDGPPQSALDWAMPAVYLNPAVAAGFAPVDATAATRAETRVTAFDLRESPVFCGRRRFFERFEQLLDPEHPMNVLVIEASTSMPGLGRARLLSELGAHAIRTGHLPLLIRARGQTATAPPRTVAQLAVELVRALVDTRIVFELPPPGDSRLLQRLAVAADMELDLADDPDEMRMDIRDRLATLAQLDPPLLAANVPDAFKLDVDALLRDARASGDASISPHSRPVLFLAGVETWDEARKALFDGLLPLWPGADAIPTIVAWNDPATAATALRDARERLRTREWIEFEPLAPFDPHGEDTLAYQWVLLHPWTEAPQGIADKVWVTSAHARQNGGSDEPQWCGRFRTIIQGMPHKVAEGWLYALVADSQSFESGDDEGVLAKYLTHQRP